MTVPIRQSTASQEIPLGYMLDSTDGNTEETGLTIANTDIKLWRHGATTLANKNSGGATHISNGIYYCVLDATDSNTLGALWVYVHVSGALAIKVECEVMTANRYDSLVLGTDKLETDVVQMNSDAQSLIDLKDFADAGYDPATNKVQGVVLCDTTTTNTDMVAAAPTSAANADAIWDEAISGHTGAGSFGAKNQLVVPSETLNDYKATGFNTVVPDAAGVAATPAEVATALSDIHLDHLLAVNYDPASKPGVATALLNELVENDGGVARYTANALEQAPSGGTNPNVLIDTTIASVTSQTVFVLTAGSNDDDAYKDQAVVVYDANDSDYPSVRKCSAYTGATKTITIDSAPAFTIVAGDGTKVFVTAPGTTAPTAVQNADAVWDELKSEHTIANSFGDYLDDEITSRNSVTPDAAGVAPTAIEIRQEMDTNSVDLNTIATDVAGLNGDAMRGTDGANTTTPPTTAANADAVWDELLTGATHNVATSAGRRLREVGAFAIHSGTAQAGSSTGITLATTANGGDGVYNRNLIVIVNGTGQGQTRTIVDYVDATKVVVVDRDWRTTPDNTSEYQIVPDDTPLTVDHGKVVAATATTITLRSYASSVNDTYLCSQIGIIAGTGRGQVRLVGAYNGTTKVATICGDNWVTTPDTTSIYVMMPYGTTCASCMGTTALTQVNTECDAALTDYDPPTRAEATTDKNAIITEVNANETKIDVAQSDLDTLTGTDGATLATTQANYAPNKVVPDVAGTATTLHGVTDGKIDTVDTVVDAIKTKTDDLPSGVAKNVALSNFEFLMVLSSDHVTPATGKTISATVSKDGAAFVALTNAVSEIASGMYKVNLTQAEMNADVVTLKFTETDCDQRIITIYTS